MKKRIFILFIYFLFVANIFSINPTLFNIGTLFVGNTSAYENTTLYVGGSIQVEGDMALIRQDGITKLTGDFINNVTSNNVFDNESYGKIEFCGTDAQNIFGTADKVLNYINFPNIKINNSKGVFLSAKMGAEVNELDLTKGKFVLLSEVNDVRPTQVDCAHLLVKQTGNVIYNRDSSDINEKGIIEVRLALSDNYQNKKIVGFSSPFKRIYSDYFAFNFLTKPSPNGLFGDDGLLLDDIRTPMNAGEGYLLGQGIVDDVNYYWDYVNYEWPNINYNDRFTTVFSFARDFMPQSFSQYNTEEDRFTGEEINITDVEVPLTRRGFNYVGNPFTVPIDLSSFVQNTGVVDDWGVTRGEAGEGELRNSFYVLSGGTGSYSGNAPKYKFTFNVSYLLGQSVGGTLSYEGESSLLIAPMQMFVVGKNNDGLSNFKIPASARKHGLARFFRAPSIRTVDEIMIEAVDEDTKGYDRLCVVFRDEATLKSNDRYDASKLFNYSRGVNQIYTQSSDNKKLTTNVFSPETDLIDMYLVPSSKINNVTLTAYRLNSLQSVSTVILEDKLLGVFVDLLQNPTYSFITNPTDNENRFTLHFSPKTITGNNITEEFPIIFYSQMKRIMIKGLTESDLGSNISVFNVNGRLIYETKISDISDNIIDKYFDTGMYILKISGSRNVVDKVIIN